MKKEAKDFNPDPGPEMISLYRCAGEVLSVRVFSEKNLDLLSPAEAVLVKRHVDKLPEARNIPEDFREPLSMSSEIALDDKPVFTTRRSGARSAYFPQRGLQLKGCRPYPALCGIGFPAWRLYPHETFLRHERILYGVMRAEDVMCEVLGYCFAQEYNFLRIRSAPLAVSAFSFQGLSLHHGLLLSIQGNERIDAQIQFPRKDLLFSELNMAQATKKPLGDGLFVGSELPFRDLDAAWVAREIGHMMAAMHWHGGFRGVLDSHIGNVVLVSDTKGETKLALTDFSSFHLLPVPYAGAPASVVDQFMLNSLVEVCMGSLPIMHYVDLPKTGLKTDFAIALGDIYFSKSSLWECYWDAFQRAAGKHGLSRKVVRDSFNNMRRTEAFLEVLTRLVPSWYSSCLDQARHIYTYYDGIPANPVNTRSFALANAEPD